QAAESFVILVDEVHGLLLIPEGTAVPAGIDFQITSDARGPRSRVTADGVEAEDAAVPRRFVYAYAAPEKFVEARRRIAEAEAKFPPPSVGQEESAKRRTGPWQIATNVASFDQTYYYSFWDGSYHAVRKNIVSQGGNGYGQYTLSGWAYSEAGDWDAKVVVSNTATAGYPGWTASKTSWFYNAAGFCYPPDRTYITNQSVVATMTSQASITRYLYPPCDLPCKSNSSSTASVSFP